MVSLRAVQRVGQLSLLLAALVLACSHPRRADQRRPESNSSTGCVVLDLDLQLDESSQGFLALWPESSFDNSDLSGSSYPIANTTIYNPHPPLCWNNLPSGTYALNLHFADFRSSERGDSTADAILQPLVPSVIIRGIRVAPDSTSYQTIPRPIKPDVRANLNLPVGTSLSVTVDWGGLIDSGASCP